MYEITESHSDSNTVDGQVTRWTDGYNADTRAVLRLVWPSILLQSARGRVATAAETVTA